MQTPKRELDLNLSGFDRVKVTIDAKRQLDLVAKSFHYERSFWRWVTDLLIEIVTLRLWPTETFDGEINRQHWSRLTLAIAVAIDNAGVPQSERHYVIAAMARALKQRNPKMDADDRQKILAFMSNRLDTLADRKLLATLAGPHFSAADRDRLASFLGTVWPFAASDGDEIDLAPSLAQMVTAEAFQYNTDAGRAIMIRRLVDTASPMTALFKPHLDAFSLACKLESPRYTKVTLKDSTRIDYEDGVSLVIHGTPSKRKSHYAHSIDRTASALGRLPAAVRATLLQTISLEKESCACYASAGAGVVRLYPVENKWFRRAHKALDALNIALEPALTAVLAHEAGHLLPIDERAWQEAAGADATLTTSRGYTGGAREDIAEAFKLYVLSWGTTDHDRYRAKWPNRFTILDAQMKALGIGPE